MAMHPRVSVNPMTTIAMPFDEAVALWLELGTTRVGLNAIQLDNTGWTDAVALVAAAGLDVRYLNYGPSARVDDAAAWEKVVSAVHAEGGKIFMQAWHVGRNFGLDGEGVGEAVEVFRRAVVLAKGAGFDGVEVLAQG